MRTPTVCSPLLLFPCVLLLLPFAGCSNPGTEDPKKALLEPQLVSPKRGVDASGPRFVPAAGKLYLFWRALKGDIADLSILAIDAGTKRLGPTQKVAFPAEILGLPHFVAQYAAIAADAAPPTDGSPVPFLVAYSAYPAGPYLSNRPVYPFARLVPNRKEGGYRAEQLGRFLPDRTDTVPGGGLIAPEQISLLRIAGGKSSLLLVGSNYSLMWSISSSDGGKTWSAPQPIAKEACGLAAVVENAAGELLLFSNAQTRVSKGRYAEVLLRRSKDGKTWSDPKEILDGYGLMQTCPFVDGKVIWLAYADKNEGRDGSTLLLTRSADGGKNWEVPLPLTDGSHDDSEPVISVQGDTLFLAFMRTVPRRPGAQKDDVKHQVWFGHKAIQEIHFPRAK